MNTTDQYREARHEKFTIREYGSGEPHRLLVGGLAYHPNDYDPLASNLPGTNFVVDNPMHTGVMDWDIEELRRQYIAIAEECDCSIAVGHSLGSIDVLEIQKALQDRIKGVVMLTPPLNDISENTATSSETLDKYRKFGMLDSVIGELCRDMDNDEYLEFLEEHFGLYGERIKANYKKGMPKNGELPKITKKLIGDMKFSAAKFLALLGSDDMWYPGEDDVPDFSENVSYATIKGGHYIHRIKAQEVSEHILDWEGAMSA